MRGGGLYGNPNRRILTVMTKLTCTVTFTTVWSRSLITYGDVSLFGLPFPLNNAFSDLSTSDDT